jgi:hypothetical protein
MSGIICHRSVTLYHFIEIISSSPNAGAVNYWRLEVAFRKERLLFFYRIFVVLLTFVLRLMTDPLSVLEFDLSGPKI